MNDQERYANWIKSQEKIGDQEAQIENLKAENQRYKQALEKISNSDSRLIRNAANCRLTASELHIKCVEEADKALRGESE